MRWAIYCSLDSKPEKLDPILIALEADRVRAIALFAKELWLTTHLRTSYGDSCLRRNRLSENLRQGPRLSRHCRLSEVSRHWRMHARSVSSTYWVIPTGQVLWRSCSSLLTNYHLDDWIGNGVQIHVPFGLCVRRPRRNEHPG